MKHFAAVVIVCVISLGILVVISPAAAADQPYRSTLFRLESLITLAETDWRFHPDVPHPEDPALDDSAWPTMKVGDKWQDERVLRRAIEVPAAINGYRIQGSRVRLDLELTGAMTIEISVFSTGSLVFHGTDEMQQPFLLTENAQPGQRLLVAIRAHAEQDGEITLARARLLVEPREERPDPMLLRDEIVAAIPVISAYENGKSEREQQLAAAIKTVDFAALARDDQGAFDTSLRDAQSKLEALNPYLKQFAIVAVGNAHIDMAWLWPWTETVEVVRNTFRSVLDLMREYPDFKFTMSSARTYQWMEEKYPDLFKEIKARVKEGRWEVIGGMWVEPDLNMPAGESLVRQILVGKSYFQSRFGVDVKIGWNPDSFGYNWQLPQIYKKSGMNYFVTQKLLWAKDFTTFPYKLFWWEAPDGSRLLTYFPHDYAGGIDAERLGNDLALWAPSIYGPRLNDTPEMMHLYGVGDHGGGPTRSMLDNAKRLMAPNVVFPQFAFSTATAFFSNLEAKLSNVQVPVWKDELYFQYHRGVFTTQSETKRRIRRGEETLLNAEKLASLAMLDDEPYPQQEFERAWKRLLFDHFHDIMPGSGIAVNYLDAERNLADVHRVGQDIIDTSLDEISAHIDTQRAGVAVVVFNTLSWPRVEVTELGAQLPGPAQQVEVVDANGKPAPSQLLSIDGSTHRVRLLVQVNVPAFGYATYFLRATTKPPLASTLKAGPSSLENEFVRLKIDRQTGCITSLFDKHSQTESLAPAETDTGGPRQFACGNLLQTFHDLPKQWDAWNIDPDFEKQHWDLASADQVTLLESGPLRAVIRVKKHFQNSAFVQDITMYPGVSRVDVRMQADWHEKHILLKVAFPLSAHNSKARFEIPYGSIERPTTRNTPQEKAEFEVPALRWADISDAQHGFSLLNDSKYGYDAKGNVLRLSLLRSPTWPDPHTDEGLHQFTYSLYPHGGDWRAAQTVRRGYELNYPLMARATENHQGSLPGAHAFIAVDPENVVVTSLKKAEADNSLILRFFEWAGKAGDVKITLPAAAPSALDTDLMERPSRELPVHQGMVSVPTQPYEIKTVKISFAQAKP
ncbi:MAG: alpha-mannosidase [Acidobacteria bacterium]|nr:alpha-mannosidase [Acidobacteriota bacterium]